MTHLAIKRFNNNQGFSEIEIVILLSGLKLAFGISAVHKMIEWTENIRKKYNGKLPLNKCFVEAVYEIIKKGEYMGVTKIEQ